jgi:hypothetical protein
MLHEHPTNRISPIPDTLDTSIHLMWNDGRILCGIHQPTRFWLNWTLNALNWSDMCPACVHAWVHPIQEGRS